MTNDPRKTAWWERPILASAAALSLIIIWTLTLPLSSSLWLDELLSAWITNGSPSDTIDRVWKYQGQSPMYFLLLWAIRNSVGSAEVMLRLPSLVAGVLSLGLLFTLCRRWWGSSAGCVAVAAILLVDEFSVAALSARPYSLAVLSLLLSLLLVEKWLHDGRPLWILGALFFSLVTFYGHYLFLAGFILPGARIWSARPRLPPGARRSIVAGFVGLALMMMPGTCQLWMLREKRELYSFAVTPTFTTLWQVTLPPPVLLAIVFSIVIVSVVRGRSALAPVRGIADPDHAPSPAVLAVWWLAPILLFFGLSSVSSNSLFLPRLFLWAYVAMAMTLAAASARCLGTRGQALVAAVFFLLALQKNVDRRWVTEDWRETARILGELPDAASGTVLLYSGLIEKHTPAWALDPAHFAYLSAPFSYYPVPQKVEILPWLNEEEPRHAFLSSHVERVRKGKLLALAINRKKLVPTAEWTDDVVVRALREQGVESVRRTGEKSLIGVWSVTGSHQPE